MKSNRKVQVVCGVVLVAVMAILLSPSTGRDRQNYRVETRLYDVPEYRSDAARAIDAYERLMERYMDLTERNLLAVAADGQTLIARLDGLDAALTKLDGRLARIERHLGIAPAPPVVTVDPNAAGAPGSASTALKRLR